MPDNQPSSSSCPPAYVKRIVSDVTTFLKNNNESPKTASDVAPPAKVASTSANAASTPTTADALGDPFHFAVYLMEKAEGFPDLKGSEKYALVRAVAETLLSEYEALLPGPVAPALRFILEHHLLSSFTTVVVQAARRCFRVNRGAVDNGTGKSAVAVAAASALADVTTCWRHAFPCCSAKHG